VLQSRVNEFFYIAANRSAGTMSGLDNTGISAYTILLARMMRTVSLKKLIIGMFDPFSAREIEPIVLRSAPDCPSPLRNWDFRDHGLRHGYGYVKNTNGIIIQNFMCVN
jgi:hypothetical protein